MDVKAPFPSLCQSQYGLEDGDADKPGYYNTVYAQQLIDLF